MPRPLTEEDVSAQRRAAEARIAEIESKRKARIDLERTESQRRQALVYVAHLRPLLTALACCRCRCVGSAVALKSSGRSKRKKNEESVRWQEEKKRKKTLL